MYKLRNTLSRERVLRVKMKIFFFWNFLFGLSFWENTRSKISRTCHCFRFLHKNMCGNISRTITDSLIVTTTSGDTVRLQTTSINGTSKLEAQRCGPEDCQVVLFFFFSLSLSIKNTTTCALWWWWLSVLGGGVKKTRQTDKTDGRTYDKYDDAFFCDNDHAKENNNDEATN